RCTWSTVGLPRAAAAAGSAAARGTGMTETLARSFSPEAGSGGGKGRVWNHAPGWACGWYHKAFAEMNENMTANAVMPPMASGFRPSSAPPDRSRPRPASGEAPRLFLPFIRPPRFTFLSFLYRVLPLEAEYRPGFR